MLKSDSITKIADALLAVQKELTVVVKNATGNRGMYANFEAIIDAVKEPLNKHGIILMQAVNCDSANNAFVETTLLHASGEFFSSTTPVYCAKPNDPQALGSGITYSKRYSLQAFLALPTADDDGESAQKKSRIEIPSPTLEEQEAIDEICLKITDTASERELSPDAKSVGAYYRCNSREKRYPKSKEDVATFLKHILSKDNKTGEDKLSQVCKPVKK
jgi:hypothetical protein